MALAARSANVSPEMSRCAFAPQTKAIAGEALDAGAAVYVKASDGKMYHANGTANTEPATFWGITPKAYALGESALAFGIGAKLGGYLSTALPGGTLLYVAATAGRLDTAPTVGGLTPVARVVPPINGGATGTDIEVVVQFTD